MNPMNALNPVTSMNPMNALNPVTSMNPMSPMNDLSSRYLGGQSWGRSGDSSWGWPHPSWGRLRVAVLSGPSPL